MTKEESDVMRVMAAVIASLPREAQLKILSMVDGECKQEPPKQEPAPKLEASKERPTAHQAEQEPPPGEPDLLTVADVARLYDFTERHARRLVKRMSHTVIRDGKRWRYAIARDIFEEGLKHQGRAF